MISSTSACKRWEEVWTLFWIVFLQPLIFNSHAFKESFPPVKAPSLLRDWRWGDACGLVDKWRSEYSQEVISGGSVKMVKFCGVCCGTRVWKATVSWVVGMWWSRDRESAMKLWVPLMCWEYKLDSFFINNFANHRATSLCAFWLFENDALYSHPSALDESVKARMRWRSFWWCVVM